MDGEPLVLAQVPSAPGARLHFSWGCGNELFCCDLSSSSGGESSQSCVQWGTLSAPQRRIAYDTIGRFVELQQAHTARDPTTASAAQQEWASALAFSQAVSTILSSAVPAGESAVEEYQAVQERALWDLLSLFSFDSAVCTGSGPPDLPKWLQSNAVAVAGGPMAAPLPPNFLAELNQAAIPEVHPQYWPTIQRLVALGWVADALELLGLHSAWLRWSGDGSEPEDTASQIAVLEAATLLLRRFPALKGRGASAGGTAREFDSIDECLTYRRAWVGQCTALLDDTTVWRRCAAAAPDTSAGAQALVEILSGRPKTVSAATTTWAELLVAQLLHVHPALGSLPELRQLLHRCVADKAPSDEFQHVLAAALDACCDADAQSALRACSEFASDWFLAHIPEVLAASPAGAAHMSRMLPHLGATQVEFYKLEFASALAPHASTWRLATEYLAWCESYGQQAFRALMHRLPFTGADTALALRAVEGCKDQGLDSLVGMLQRVQGAVCWQEGLVGSAIAWFGLADDLGRADAALQPTVSLIQGGAEAASAEDALLEALDVLPPGSSNHALLRVKALMRGGRGREGGNGSKPELHQAVEVLRQLPGRQRQQCLELVWGALPCVDPSALSEGDVTQLLEWLEGAEGADGENGKAVARLALVRLLAASHLRGNGKTAIV